MRGPGSELERARARFLDGALAEPGVVRHEIVASWERSRSAGVDAGHLEVPYRPDLDFDGSLASCARPVLDDLAEQLSGTPVSVVLTDADGHLLARRVGEGELRRRLDEISLAPGFSYAEEHAGTNGVGTALEGGAPALVIGAEHFTDRLRGFACAGAPIRHPLSHRVVGVLDVTCLRPHANDLMRVLATRAAHDVEQVLLQRGSATSAAVMSEFERACRRGPQPVLALTDDYVVANRAAHTVLGPGDQDRVVRHALERRDAPGRPRVLLTHGPARLHLETIGSGRRPIGLVVTVEIAHDGGRAVRGPVGTGPTPPGGRSTPSARWRERSLSGLAGSSASWLGTCRDLRLAAADRRATLVLGEPGVGKCVAVRAVHRELRPTARCVVVDCAAGGATVRAGLAEVGPREASPPESGLTVILRHLERIDDDGASAVAPLLDAADDGARWIVGTVTGDAVPPDSPAADLLGAFEAQVVLEPLRRRSDDVAALVPALLARLAPGRRSGCHPEATRLLAGGLWHGNVRQLEDVLRHALAERPAGDIEVRDLPAEFAAHGTRRRLSPLEAVERDMIVKALLDAGGNRVRAAAALGMGRATLYRRLSAFGLTDVGR